MSYPDPSVWGTSSTSATHRQRAYSADNANVQQQPPSLPNGLAAISNVRCTETNANSEQEGLDHQPLRAKLQQIVETLQVLQAKVKDRPLSDEQVFAMLDLPQVSEASGDGRQLPPLQSPLSLAELSPIDIAHLTRALIDSVKDASGALAKLI